MSFIVKQKFSTPNKSSGRNTCEYIVLHHTATNQNTGLVVAKNFSRSGNNASCHYTVDTNGDIYQVGEEYEILWHAGQSEWQWKNNINQYSIGIEIVGYGNGDFTDAQRISVRQIVQTLLKKYNLSPNNVVRHWDIATKWDASDNYNRNRKTDVAHSFWNNQYSNWESYKRSYDGKKVIWDGERGYMKATDAEIRIMFNRANGLSDNERLVRSVYFARFLGVKVSDGSRPFDVASDFEIATMFTRFVLKNSNAKNNTLTRQKVADALIK